MSKGCRLQHLQYNSIDVTIGFSEVVGPNETHEEIALHLSERISELLEDEIPRTVKHFQDKHESWGCRK